MKVRRALCAVVVCLGMAGCSAVPVGIQDTPSVAVVTPQEGQSLAQRGFTHPPADQIWLPSSTILTYTADQPNLLIGVGPADQSDTVQEFLRETLPGLGWQITADAPGGLLFERGAWHGAYALGDTSWALTVRDD
ncbi:MAG: hypothetical protein FWD75_06195 [Propionibacteriaceae bacterium]|nr:hypothetical protein [Propionibacteriaceae bacterium]